ncbi:MAG: hypothetical protein QXR73_00695 [Candidatus Micrarchaeaceae archaeon]
MVDSDNRKLKSADYNGTEVIPVSRNDSYDLKEFDIKKEYLLKVVLPFAHKLESNPVDIIVEDRAGFGYVRRLLAEELQRGDICLYEIINKRKVFVSEYNVSFDAGGKICNATEDRDFEEKHVSVVYKVNELQEGYKRLFEARPSSVVVSFKRDNKNVTKLYVNSGIGREDILEEIKFPNNFVQVIKLRSDE